MCMVIYFPFFGQEGVGGKAPHGNSKFNTVCSKKKIILWPLVRNIIRIEKLTK